MAKSYNSELRKEVLAHFIKFRNKSLTARVFNIHYSTVAKWNNQFANGVFAAAKRGPKQGNFKKIDPLELCQFVENNKGMSSLKLAAIFKVSHVAIWKVLRKFGYIYKDNTYIKQKD